MLRGGFSMLKTFDTCQRKYFFKYRMRIVPQFRSMALVDGDAKHKAIAKYYTSGLNPDAMIEEYYKVMTESKGEIDGNNFAITVNQGELVLKYWLSKYHPDKKYYLIETEKVRTLKINDFTLILKPDAVMEEINTNRLCIFERKTTSWSPKILGKVRSSDQLTCYMWGYEKLHNKRVDIGIPEVLYQNGKVISITRAEVYRTRDELEDFEFGLYDIVSEIEAKQVLDDPRIYRRALDCDSGSSYECEYKNICRTTQEIGNIPYGYKEKEHRE